MRQAVLLFSRSCYRSLLNINDGIPPAWTSFCWYIINSGELPLFQCCSYNLNTLAKNWLKIFFWGLIAVQNCIIIINLMILSNILSICWKSRVLQKDIPRFSWIVVDLPCFSDVRFSKADMLSYCCFCISVQSNFNGSDTFGTIERCSR